MLPDSLHHWLAQPQELLVAGDDSYAAALAVILGTDPVSLRTFRFPPATDEFGRLPRIFERLRHVFFVVPKSCSSAEALECHRSVWDWVGKLSSTGDHHELTFFFILPPEASGNYEECLAAGLAVPHLNPATTGHAAWRQWGTLQELLACFASIRPLDMVPLRARRAADLKHSAIARLSRSVLMHGKKEDACAAARAVMGAFTGCEYQLDLFCRAPSHRHGSLLRGWLHEGVTQPVTHEWWANGKDNLARWLAHRDQTQ